jgi:hypothetical protein
MGLESVNGLPKRIKDWNESCPLHLLVQEPRHLYDVVKLAEQKWKTRNVVR